MTGFRIRGGNFRAQAEERIREALETALDIQDTEQKIEEEMLARVNVLKDISAQMAEELGREATGGGAGCTHEDDGGGDQGYYEADPGRL